MPQLIVFCTVLLGGLVGRAQLPHASSLDELARKSDAVIVAVVESKAWVVRPEKMLAGKKNSSQWKY